MFNLDTVESRKAYREIMLKDLNVVQYPEIDAVIGYGTTPQGKPTARAFTGTRAKPNFNYYFKTIQDRDNYIEKWIESQKKNIEYKEQFKAKKKAPRIAEVPYRIGDIIYCSWGYDQTNIDFYEVVRVTKASIFIRPIAQTTTETGFMSGHTVPRPGAFTGDEIRKAINWYDGKPYISFTHGAGGKYKEGEEIYCSWYA